MQAAPLPVRLFIAERQLAGRGRDGKIWLKSDLTASFLWPATEKTAPPAKAAAAAGGKETAPEAKEDQAGKAAEAAETEDLSLKFTEDLRDAALAVWPSSGLRAEGNDLLMRKGEKIAGVLLEFVAAAPSLQKRRPAALIAGLGMNVFSHPPYINAGHLREGAPSLSEKEWGGFLGRLHGLWGRLAVAVFLKN